jgi:hypothetical protein
MVSSSFMVFNVGIVLEVVTPEFQTPKPF